MGRRGIRFASTAILAAAWSTAACGESPGGRFSALTYNVAGLPEGLSKSSPEKNSPLISPMLNRYDLVLVQEDFTYHEPLASQADHPYRSVPKTPETKLVADGLNRFSQSAFSNHVRAPWTICNGGLDSGSDCLSEKGYSVATHTLAPEMEVDIYNLHFDAGGDVEDVAARSAQVDQLLAAIQERSNGRAIIIGGDTNLRTSREADVPLLDRLVQEAGLSEACAAVGCPDSTHIDRFFFRSSERIELEASSWAVDEAFVDEAQEPLSDHPAVTVVFDYHALD